MPLLDQIRESCTPELIASQDYQAIADVVNVGRVRIVSRQIGFGLVLDALGSDAGASVLDAIDALRASVPKLKYTWILLEAGTLDVGLKSTRDGLDDLALKDIMSTEQSSLLKALAEEEDHVTEHQIEVAMKNDDGSFKL